MWSAVATIAIIRGFQGLFVIGFLRPAANGHPGLRSSELGLRTRGGKPVRFQPSGALVGRMPD